MIKTENYSKGESLIYGYSYLYFDREPKGTETICNSDFINSTSYNLLTGLLSIYLIFGQHRSTFAQLPYPPLQYIVPQIIEILTLQHALYQKPPHPWSFLAMATDKEEERATTLSM